MASEIVSAGTSEGGQELQLRSDVSAKAVLRESGAVLRMSESQVASLADTQSDDQTMIINMGPQHPSTHGVLRLMLELKGETVLRCKPVIGYLHTGMEKTGESLTFMQGGTNVTRMDYASPLNNELVFSMATEKLLGIDQDIPERAVWIRMMLSELNRISSHLLFMATNGMDIGAVSMMLYGFREREEVLRFFQKVTGLRMNHNFIRPGGVAADLPAGWRDEVLGLLDALPQRLAEYEILMTGQPVIQNKSKLFIAVAIENRINRWSLPVDLFYRSSLWVSNCVRSNATTTFHSSVTTCAVISTVCSCRKKSTTPSFKLVLKLFFCSDHATWFKNPIQRKRDCYDGKKRKTNKLSTFNFFTLKTFVVVIRFAVCRKFNF